MKDLSFLKSRYFVYKGIYDNKNVYENTIEAIKVAIRKNKAIYLTVCETKDKELIICENDCLTRIQNQKDNINYTLKDEEELQGTINSQVIPDVKKYIGFTEPEKQTITIEEDEITILNYYYIRNKYKVILNKDEGIENVNGADSYYYEQSVAIEAQVKDGYKWKNWSGSETYSDIKNTFKMPAQNIELTANSEKNKENIDEGKTDIKDDKDELDEKTKDNRNNLNNDETVIDKIIPKAGKNIILIFVVIVIAIINFIVYVKYKKYSDIK